MNTLGERVLALVEESPGPTDRELTNRLVGAAAGQQPVNQAARKLVNQGRLDRHRRPDGKIGNYPAGASPPPPAATPAVLPKSATKTSDLSEDDVKRRLKIWLEDAGWQVEIKWGHDRGIDVVAKRGSEVWVIEAKGCGSRNPMRVNYFLAMLGETLQRMEEPSARYSIALPDMKQYRGLWNRLPKLAKSRTGISALFVAPDGEVIEA